MKYREEQRQHLLEENRVKHVQAEQAEAERQHRLEVLRQQVRIEAPVDPLRLLRETKAYQSRLLSTQSEDNKELPLQTPLFSQCGYTDQQVTLDMCLLRPSISCSGYFSRGEIQVFRGSEENHVIILILTKVSIAQIFNFLLA